MSSTRGKGLPQDEIDRIAALKSYDVLDTPEEQVFDDVVRLAASLMGMPIALVSLVDGKRQWFKAKVGLTAVETPRDVAFCAHAIEDTGVFVVPDALRDDRFSTNPLVTDGPQIRFYAGAPLIAESGHALGTLCVIDQEPRDLTAEQRETLKLLAQHVMAQLELRRRLRSVTQDAATRASALDLVKRAFEAGEFHLHYQPQFDCAGRVCGMEGLLRWHSPVRGILLPGEFIRTLEESSFINTVGAWVLQQAAGDYRAWVGMGLACPPISVNVAPRQLIEHTFLAAVKRATAGVTLELEVTEGSLVHDLGTVVKLLRELREMGHTIALDDFGSGYSSLGYLAHLPIDTLKMDRSLIYPIASSSNHMAVASAVIQLAHGMKLKVVAEGVETREQESILRLVRCDVLQGWLYSQAIPVEDMTALLKREADVVSRRPAAPPPRTMAKATR